MRRERNPFQKLTGERERERRVCLLVYYIEEREKKNKQKQKQKLEKRREGLGERELLGRGDKNKKYI